MLTLASLRSTLALLVVSSVFAAAPARGEQRLATPAEIDRACNATEKHADKHKREAHIFADVSSHESHEEGIWRSFPSAAALEHATPDGPPYTQAFVSTTAAGMVFVEMFFTSRSGDWAHYSDLCYRPDGTLARAVDTLNTFNAVDDNDDDS